MVSVKVYLAQLRALLDTGALPNIISKRLCEEPRLSPTETSRRLTVLDGARTRVLGEVGGAPVTFDTPTTHHTFLVLVASPFDLNYGNGNSRGSNLNASIRSDS